MSGKRHNECQMGDTTNVRHRTKHGPVLPGSGAEALPSETVEDELSVGYPGMARADGALHCRAMTNTRTPRRFTGRLAMSLTVAVVVFAAACSSNDGRGEQLSLNKPLFPTIEET